MTMGGDQWNGYMTLVIDAFPENLFFTTVQINHDGVFPIVQRLSNRFKVQRVMGGFRIKKIEIGHWPA